MTERKTIQINPDLFKFSDKSRKRKPPSDDAPKIKMKSNISQFKHKTLRKSVMKMIREKQQEEYQKLFENDSKKKPSENIPQSNSKSEFTKDFDDSFEYLSSLVEKNKSNPPSHNQTLKQYPPINSVLMQPSHDPFLENISLQLSPDLANTTPIRIQNPIAQRPSYQQPSYGCLKNGSLPTYRIWKNQTQKQPVYNQPIIHNQYPTPISYTPPIIKPRIEPVVNPESSMEIWKKQQHAGYLKELEDSQKVSENRQQYMKSINNSNKKLNNKIKYLKRKKITKRTFHIGKSKMKPQIGVLVSNRTIRNRVTSTTHALKQTPIHEVRRFLIKKGFIKVGSNAPNDVLRKMFESVSLICGQVENHNPENLLYNFIHDKTE